MRIAFITETWLPSTDGVVTRVTATLRELKKMGQDLLVIAPEGGEPEFEGIPVKSVPNVQVSFIYGGKPWGLPVPRVGQYLDAFQPDVVHVVNPFVVGIAGVLHANRRRWPLVASYHTSIARYAEFYHLGFTKPLIWAILRALHNRAAINLTPSLAVKEEIERHGISRVYLWPRGVDIELFHPSRRAPEIRRALSAGDPARPLLLYVGRLAAEKGLDRLREVFDRGLPVSLALVGDGPERAHLEQWFAGTPTVFTGILRGQALAQAYASADLFVFPSMTDTLGLVILEAMASGLPVLAAASPPSRELLDGTGAGVLFAPDQPGQLAQEVERLLDQGPPAWREMGRRGRSVAEELGWQRPTQELLQYYRAVCQSDLVCAP